MRESIEDAAQVLEYQTAPLRLHFGDRARVVKRFIEEGSDDAAAETKLSVRELEGAIDLADQLSRHGAAVPSMVPEQLRYEIALSP